MKPRIYSKNRILFTTLFLTGAILFLGGSAQGEDVASEDAAQGEDVASGDAAQAESTSEEETKTESSGEDTDSKYTTSSRTWDLKATPEQEILFVEIKGPIDLGIAPFLQRVVDEAEERENVVAILTEIHTPGGRVDAAVEIKNALLQATVPTFAWVHSEAISAGALIAYAHDGIFFSRGGTMGAATPIQMAPGGGAQPVGEKVVSYMRGVMRATAEAKDRDGALAEAMVDATLEIPGITAKDKLVTLTDEEALRWGVADGSANSRSELLEQLGLAEATVTKVETNWAEEVARFLTGPTLSGLLMAIGMLGLFLEFSTPGFGIPGIAAVIAFSLFFVGHFVVHLAGAEELALLGFGVLLLGLEIFVIPGFGVAGIGGLIAVLAALVMMMVALPLDVSWEIGSLDDAISRVSLALAATIGLAFVAVQTLPKSKTVNRLVLQKEMTGADGFESFATDSRKALLGQTGRVEMDLGPSGKARIGGDLVDVVSEGGYVEKGSVVSVVRVEGARVVVRSSANEEGLG